MLITNTENVAGREITQHLGVVKGATVQSKHIGRDIMAGLKNIIGGELAGYTELLEDARTMATDRMIAEAHKVGADAIVNIRYATTTVTPSASELMVYGTAVKLSG